MRGFFIIEALGKVTMKAGLAALPYSRKALQTLADTLKIHRSMVWLDPVSNSISLKQLESRDKEVETTNPI